MPDRIKTNAGIRGKYRKAQELTCPELGPDAEINRRKKSGGLRLTEDRWTKIDELAAEEGMTRTQWLTRLIDEALEP